MSMVQQAVDLLQQEQANGDAVKSLNPEWDFNGLASQPKVLQRSWWRGAVTVVVPPGATAIVYGPHGSQRILAAGSHALYDLPRGTVLMQLVRTARFQHTLGPIEGWSADKWKVRMLVEVDVAVSDAPLIAAHIKPLQALNTAIRSGLLQQFEGLSHAALTGLDEHSGGIDAVAAMLLARLQTDPALKGFTISQVHIIDRVGDERRIEAATETAVAVAQLEESMRLKVAEDQAAICEFHGKAARMQAEHDIRMAELVATEREELARQDFVAQRHTMTAQVRILEAGISAQIAQLAHAEQQWQAEQQRWQVEWQATVERIQSAHATDQHVRLLEAQNEWNATLLERTQVRDERRARLEQELLLMQHQHEQLLQQHREHLESWRVGHDQHMLQLQQSHVEHLALIQGATAIATATNNGQAQSTRRLGESYVPYHATNVVASEGLRTLLQIRETAALTQTTDVAQKEVSDAHADD